MIAIHTKYLPATDKTGSRVKASVYRARGMIFAVTVPYDHAADCPHTVAAQALVDKHWKGRTMFYVGATIDGNGDVFSLREPA